MILIADSGSTKTEWQVVGHSKGHFYTSGINPYFQTQEEIVASLQAELPLEVVHKVTHIFFYGAGCNTDAVKAVVENALLQVIAAEHVEVESDLLGAARALCQHEEGIACILGTGSNSCAYDGKNIVQNVSPLGFILGDEGSGAVLGKRLVGDVLKHQLPESICDAFYKEYGYQAADIIAAVYRQPFPNRYLAQFSRFIVKHLDEPALAHLVRTEFMLFFTRNVMHYSNYKHVPIHFVGSVALHYRDLLKEVMKHHGLMIGTIEQAPMQGLIAFHNSNFNLKIG